MFSKKATQIDEIFPVTLTICNKINGKDFLDFCGLLRKHELYHYNPYFKQILLSFKVSRVQIKWHFLTKDIDSHMLHVIFPIIEVLIW